MEKNILDKSIELIDILNTELNNRKLFGNSKLFNDIPIINNSNDNTYIDDITKIILPELKYIKTTLQKKKTVQKKKVTFGGLIVHEWSNKSHLGKMLMEIYNMIHYN